eukprot:1172384-Alexandrium_andersonii.AAC.1
MARYGASLVAALKGRGLWTTHLWERTFVAIEHDFLGARSTISKLKVKPQEVEAASSGSTSQRLIQLDER